MIPKIWFDNQDINCGETEEMSVKVWFDEQDVTHKALTGQLIVQKDVLHFHFHGDIGAPNGNALQIDTPATEKHKRDYRREFDAFITAKAEMFKAVETPETVKPIEAEHD
jgi:hypothetical protein